MDMEQIVKAQHLFFEKGVTLSPDFRLAQLNKLERALSSYEPALLQALELDLGKARFEGYTTELMVVKEELRYVKKHLRRFARGSWQPMPLLHFPAVGRVVPQPLGVALIMSPWNYPLQLTLNPLIAALAAGCCACVKPSRYAKNTALLLEKMLTELYPPQYVAVFQGGAAANTALLALPFDKIFFTGSPAVGHVVMEAAAKHLTPVTLELGGKSPCIVDETAPVALSAKRIAFGKFTNAGQTCVAPDYLLVQKKVYPALAAALEKEITAMYGESPLSNPEYPHIINEKHFNRLCALLEEKQVLYGGGRDENTLRIAPTLLRGVTLEDAVMQEEIFGPLLPILTYETQEEAMALVRSQKRPLALYLFTRKPSSARRWLREVPFGGGCVNDTLIHLASPRLPFGGIGDSGMGTYHGLYGLEEFTHQKGIVLKGLWPDIPVRYAPYKNKLDLVKKLTK